VAVRDQPAPGLEIDGYRLVRQIGEGGFGSVWLCWSQTTESFHALKWVSGDAGKHEQEALIRFREISQRLRSPNLIAIEHINRFPFALIYTLPLADGIGAEDPADEAWRPLTLADVIETRGNPWFSSTEIRKFILPVIRATADLNEAGLVHRDIKPANILFFGGVPCLADVGLLSKDTVSLTQRGTPGFLPPSWYLESSGQPDMWGLATTLYSLLTGNHPDKIGRSGFLWPPNGKDSLTADEHAAWQSMHAAILRATHEKASERFRDFRSLAAAVEGKAHPIRPGRPAMIAALMGLVALVAMFSWMILGNRTMEMNVPATPAVAHDVTEPEVSAEERRKEMDAAVEHIVRRLEKEQAGPSAELREFRERAWAATDKMRSFKKTEAGLENSISNMVQLMGRKFQGSGDISKRIEPEVVEGPGTSGSEEALDEIRTELRDLASNPPQTSISANAVRLNRIYSTLVDDIYSKATGVEEKLYFNNVLRPRLDEEFKAIFGFKPGQIPYDTTGLNMQMAMTGNVWSSLDEKTLAEIKLHVKEISKALNPDQ
jgi:serine/threonine protein kinase